MGETVIRQIGLFVYGMCSGVLVASGVFTVLLAVGLTPRFAGKTKTADKILCYENSIILGTVVGTLCSISQTYQKFCLGVWGEICLFIIGIFIGMFVGCLALAIAEMLDSIPIFSRRIGFRHGLGIAVTCTAIGKFLGSLLYFYWRLGN